MRSEFMLHKVPIILSDLMELGTKPCEVVYILELPVNVVLSYLAIKNYYTFSISIDQLQFEGEVESIDELKPSNSNCVWVRVAENIQLMKHAHYEGDAEDWHIIPIDKLSGDFKQSQLKILRIHIWQPSPNWYTDISRLMYSLSEIIAFEKKPIYHSTVSENKESGFDSLKKKLKENMRKLQTHECTMQCDVYSIN